MVDIKDFINKDGGTNWNKYREAQKDAGIICHMCESCILSPHKGFKRLCNSCDSLFNNNEKVSSSKMVRCPRCGYIELVEHFGIHEEGDQNVDCSCCEFEYKVLVIVTYCFESPARDTKNSYK